MESIKIYYRVRNTGLGQAAVEFFHDEAVAKWAEKQEEGTEHHPSHLTQSSVGTLEINVTQGLSKRWGGKGSNIRVPKAQTAAEYYMNIYWDSAHQRQEFEKTFLATEQPNILTVP
jgi:hypothetical protein